MRESNGTVEGRSRLNESTWEGLEKEFSKGGTGSPLDDMLVGSSRVSSHSHHTTFCSIRIIELIVYSLLLSSRQDQRIPSSLVLLLPSLRFRRSSSNETFPLPQIPPLEQQHSLVSSKPTTERSVQRPKRPLVVHSSNRQNDKDSPLDS